MILEECLTHCGIHNELTSLILQQDSGMRVDCLHLGADYVTHGSLDDLYKHCGLDGSSIADRIWEVRQSEN